MLPDEYELRRIARDHAKVGESLTALDNLVDKQVTLCRSIVSDAETACLVEATPHWGRSLGTLRDLLYDTSYHLQDAVDELHVSLGAQIAHERIPKLTSERPLQSEGVSEVAQLDRLAGADVLQRAIRIVDRAIERHEAATDDLRTKIFDRLPASADVDKLELLDRLIARHNHNRQHVRAKWKAFRDLVRSHDFSQDVVEEETLPRALPWPEDGEASLVDSGLDAGVVQMRNSPHPGRQESFFVDRGRADVVVTPVDHPNPPRGKAVRRAERRLALIAAAMFLVGTWFIFDDGPDRPSPIDVEWVARSESQPSSGPPEQVAE